jgi:hypothetical protein
MEQRGLVAMFLATLSEFTRLGPWGDDWLTGRFDLLTGGGFDLDSIYPAPNEVVVYFDHAYIISYSDRGRINHNS